MPSGTPCGQSEKAFCVMGKCLEFGPDQTPLQYEISGETLTNIENVMKKPRSLLRHLLKKRALFIEPPTRVAIDQSCLQSIVRQVNATHFSLNSEQDHGSVSEIAFDDPVDIDADFIPHAEFEAFVSDNDSSSSSYGGEVGQLFLLKYFIMFYFVIMFQ